MTAGISLIPGKTGAHRAPLQRKLELDFGTEQHSACVTQKGCRILSKRRVDHYGYRISEVVMVPQIFEVTPQLDFPPFVERDLLTQGEVPLRVGRTAERIASESAAARHGVCQNRSGWT